MAGVKSAATYDARSPWQRARLRINMLAVIPYLMIALLLAVWESVAHSSLVTPFMLPSIEAVAARIVVDVTSGERFHQSRVQLSTARWSASAFRRWPALPLVC